MNKKLLFLILILLIFGGIFASVSLINHYLFRTFAYDLGIFNQAAFHYSHFQWNTNTVLHPTVNNLLSDHMGLILIPLSFSQYFFGSYGILVMQIIAVLIGGLGCYHLVKEIDQRTIMPYLAMIHFFCFVGVISALGFDYHNNVVGASMVPWFYYYIKKEKFLASTIIALLIISCKENLALYLTAIAFGLLFFDKSIPSRGRRNLLLLSLFGIFYFFFMVKFLMPYLDSDGVPYNHFKYSLLGEDWSSAFKNIIQKPFKYIKYLFINHTNDPFYDDTKNTFWLVCALSGGIASLINPRYLFAALFILLQKMFNDDVQKWGLGVQYSIALAPILTVGLFDAVSQLKKRWVSYTTAIAFLAITIYSTYDALENDIMAWVEKNRLQFYTAEHYQSDYEVESIYEHFQIIPKNASISAEYNIVPHFALRDKIYTFPVIEDAEYIVLFPNDKLFYPAKEKAYNEILNDLIESDQWKKEVENKDLLILKRCL